MSGSKGSDEGFLSRWSRRKQAVRDGAEDEIVPVAEAEATTAVAEPEEAEDDPELLANKAAAEAVDLESLTPKSDMSVFLKKGVPKALKAAAFRKLWASDPVFAVLDGLNDYDEDFRAVDTLATEFRTAWEVGKGYKAKAEEMAAEAERLAKEASAAPTPGTTAEQSSTEPESAVETAGVAQDVGDVRPQDDVIAGTQETAAPQIDLPSADLVEDEPRKVPIRRRMSVSFEEG